MINIRKYRKQKGLTMKELGNMVGVSESAIGYWETGKRKPDYGKLLEICDALGCSFYDLVTDEQIEQPKDRLTPEQIELIDSLPYLSDSATAALLSLVRQLKAEDKGLDSQG